MADRYDMALGEEAPKDKEQTNQGTSGWDTSSGSGVKVWPMKVRLIFSPDTAQWQVTIKYDDEEDWKYVKHRVMLGGGSYRTESLTFNTKTGAEEWCREKGLI